MKNNPMFVILLFLLTIAGPVSAFQENGKPYQSKTFTVNAPGNLEVTTSGSSVKVSGNSGNDVVIDMFVKYRDKQVSAKDSEVEELLKDFELEFTQTGNKISIISKQKGNWDWKSKNRIDLSFHVSVPFQMSTFVKSSGGSFSMTEIEGEHEIHTSGGSVKISDSKGELMTKSSGGSFQLNGFNGNANIQTSGGSIKISQLTGDLDISSAGGSVALEEIDGGILVNSSGGSIKAQMSSLEKEMILKSSGGSITAIVPEGTGLDLDLRGGRVKSSLSNFSGEIKDDRVLGTLNGGGIPVKMESSGGSITLDFVN